MWARIAVFSAVYLAVVGAADEPSSPSGGACYNDAERVAGQCLPLADCPWTESQAAPGFPHGFPQVCSFWLGQPLVCCPNAPLIHGEVPQGNFSQAQSNSSSGTPEDIISFVQSDSPSGAPNGNGSSASPPDRPSGTPEDTISFVQSDSPKGTSEETISFVQFDSPRGTQEETISFVQSDSPSGAPNGNGSSSLPPDGSSDPPNESVTFASFESTGETWSHDNTTELPADGTTTLPIVDDHTRSTFGVEMESQGESNKRVAEISLPFEASWLTREEAPAGPFDVTTILRLRVASSLRNAMTFHSDGALEVHSRTNAAGLPFRVSGRAVGPAHLVQFPEITSYDPSDGWTATNWTKESSPGPAPPIQPRRVGGDPVSVGESVRIRLTGTPNGGNVLIGLCGERSCSVVQALGVSKDNQLGYWTRIANTDDVRDDGPIMEERSNWGFVAGENYTFVVQRRTEREMAFWLESNPSDVITVPLEPDRAQLKFDSSAGPAYFVQEGEQRSDGDSVKVDHHVRILVITSVDRGQRIWLGMCGEDSCSVVKVVGVSQSLSMGYQTYYTNTSSLHQSSGNPIAKRGPVGFISRQRYVFVVHRASEMEMAVWLEDNPSDKVMVPLQPDRDHLKVDSTSGPYFFIEDTVWATRDPAGVLESPPLQPLQGKLCASVVYMSSRRHSGVRLSARLGNGPPVTLATITPDYEGGWRHSRVIVGVPEGVLRGPWRLLVSAHRPSPEAPVLLQRVAGCNPWDEEDIAVIGEDRVPYFQPGFNVSWASPRLGLPPTTQLSCANGGRLDEIGSCVCPPGFAGPLCLTACGFNRFGSDCEGRCSRGANTTRGCRGMLLCAPGMDCQCGAGLKGPHCNQPCSAGEYGAGCSQTCYLCKGGPCDRFSGICPEDKRPFCPSACGKAVTGAEALVLNGEPVPVGGFPWHAAIFRKNAARDGQLDYHCGGVLVMPHLILSAAHCFYMPPSTPKQLPASEFSVALGKLFSAWDAEEASYVHRSQVKRILIPDSFVGVSRNYDHDIALVELLTPVPTGKNISSICIDPAVILTAGDELQVAGWGSDTQPLADLMFIRVPFMPNVQCLRRAPSVFIRFITDDKICSFIDFQGLGRGDSGGGLVVERQGVWYLQGLVSNRHMNAYVFTNVLYHLRWMQDVYPLGCDSLPVNASHAVSRGSAGYLPR